MTEAAPAIDRVFEALCFYNSIGGAVRQAEVVKFCVIFHSEPLDYCPRINWRNVR